MPRDLREKAMAMALLKGKSARQAAKDAGYKESYANMAGARIARRESVRQAMLEIAKSLRPGELGNLGKAILHQDLLKPPKEIRGRMAVVRTALEVDGMLNMPGELHLHQHTTLPPVVQRMLEEKMMLIMGGTNGQLPERAESQGENRENAARVQDGDPSLGLKDGTSG